MSTGSSSEVVPFWSAALQKTGAAQYKIKKSDVIHFPEFHAAIAFVDDVYWKRVLYDCSRKKLPRNFIYNNYILRYRPKDTYITLPSGQHEISEFCAAAIFFFREQGKIYSGIDIAVMQRRTEEKIFETLSKRTEDWSSISYSKPRRTLYIRDYVEKYYSKYGKDIREQLFTQINIAFGTKYLTKAHVTFENGEITKIDGFSVIAGSPGRVEKTRPFKPMKEKKRKESSGKSKLYQHHNRWIKFLANFEKKIAINTKSSYTKTTYSSEIRNSTASLAPSTDDSDTKTEFPSEATEIVSLTESSQQIDKTETTEETEESDYSDSS
ncbi:MAG: hypothetical protein Solivirus7_9 [Solivirus sp.]|uniref:Uncharacterized protein n=1 Tax=Solivirus sp. TaxID=2487772 RepID=A0A3G5AII1_9VIRU|nr:MAG: hypothetical protein Solivirus7_9 [Solivirus sp.]